MADKPESKTNKKYLWIAIAAAVAAILAVVAWQRIPIPTPNPDFAAADTTKVDTVAVVQNAIANAATKPQTAEPQKPEVKTETPAETTKPEPVAPTQNVAAPESSKMTETAMVAAYTDGGEYRAYTLTDWDGFTAAQRAKVTPIGVQLSASGQKFIVALTAIGTKNKWEDKDKWEDCVDIPGLWNITIASEAKLDFNGRSNTNTILAYGREHGINYPAVKAAVYYSVKGHSGWYLPASGQLWLMYENVVAIDKVLAKIGGESLSGSWLWSSTEYGASNAWTVTMYGGSLGIYGKKSSTCVRPVTSVP